ncbi:MAG: cytochrome c1 [Legionellales bacterium]|nr:cytochrome c1 [Legionellales bacterium]
MRKGILGIVALSTLLLSPAVQASGQEMTLDTFQGRLCDDASLQRGAGVFMNYCAGCHSLQYMRYKGLGEGIGIRDARTGEALEDLIQQQLNFVTDKVHDAVVSAIPAKDAESWFGVAPPDLTLVARVRGTDWLYTYLKSFYKDTSRPWGVNNLVFPDVGMPHVLVALQGVQEPVMKTVSTEASDGAHTHEVIDHLELVEPGLLTPEEYDVLVTDLVNFLEFTGEPIKLERQRLGVWVMLFLVIFMLFTWLLKREYWKDVH